MPSPGVDALNHALKGHLRGVRVEEVADEPIGTGQMSESRRLR
ncbi:MAG: hypothetical protein RL352_1190, partial [Actinomycetota bacterium]